MPAVICRNGGGKNKKTKKLKFFFKTLFFARAFKILFFSFSRKETSPQHLLLFLSERAHRGHSSISGNHPFRYLCVVGERPLEESLSGAHRFKMSSRARFFFSFYSDRKRTERIKMFLFKRIYIYVIIGPGAYGMLFIERRHMITRRKIHSPKSGHSPPKKKRRKMFRNFWPQKYKLGVC
jgi:hypothetical protein